MAQVTVSFSYKTTQGAAATGSVRLRELNQPASSVKSVTLSGGTGSIALTITGASKTYVVTEQIDGASRQTYEITVLASPTSVNLATLRPAI